MTCPGCLQPCRGAATAVLILSFDESLAKIKIQNVTTADKTMTNQNVLTISN